MLTLTANNHFTAAAFLPQTVHFWVCLSTFLHLHVSPWNSYFSLPRCVQLTAHTQLLPTSCLFFFFFLSSYPVSHNLYIICFTLFSPISVYSLSLQNAPLLHHTPPSPVGVSCHFWHMSGRPDVCVGCCWKLGHAAGETDRERSQRIIKKKTRQKEMENMEKKKEFN